MRLQHIRLAGFKSFAEPTTFQLPGQRVGVVGPNGCGKSNIMDAVRWVLGESKASELRGESMQDVIFNGSGQRKPASRASVELVFSNEDGRAGGSWNQYAEIAVKRVLTRDGTSSYFINNQPVRRRDVQDVFLGTGLGPRAYAIIGQGTISRIIESRPEELRLFLEEAAGVSKYKERRRETENRLKDTRENLTRVEDILRELNTNLDKLERQAEMAQRYRALQDEGTRKLHQLWFLKHQGAASEAERVAVETREAATALEVRSADLRHTEAQLETLRQQHYAASDALHLRQGDLAQAALEVSRLEERIRYVIEGRKRAEARLADLSAQSEQWRLRRTEAEAEQTHIAEQLTAADEQAQVLAAQAEEQASALPGFEDALRAAQMASNSQRTSVAQVQQQIQVLAAESRSVDEQSRTLRARRERLAAERQNLAAPDTQRLAALQAHSAEAEAQRAGTEARLAELADQLPLLEAERRRQQEAANHEVARQADVSARLEALRALQEKVQTGGKLGAWRDKHGLGGLHSLWQRLHVEPGWEAALEAALRERLHALEVSRLDTVRAFATDLPPTRLAFYATDVATPPAAAGRARLLDRVRTPEAGVQQLLAHWLAGVYTVATLDEALAQRPQLAPGEVLMTPGGHAVMAGAVSFYAPDSEQAGLLARAQEIENLTREVRAQALLADESRAALVRLDARVTEAQAQLGQARREAGEAQSRAHALQVQVLQLAQQAEAATSRGAQLAEELAEVDGHLEELAERRAVGEARFEELDAQLADAQQRHADLDDTAIAAERALAGARDQQRALERQAQDAHYQRRALDARQGELARALETASQQMAANAQAGEQLQLELGGFDDVAAQEGLQGALALRTEKEAALSAARQHYDELAAQLRSVDEQRLGHERSLEPLRARLTQLQLDAQAAQLGGAQYLEQLQAAEVDLAVLAAQVAADGVVLHGLQAEIDRLQREVNALGAVNLAALDELGAARERKTFLDAQSADLLDAITTLEDAIHKIDLETRELLMTTFNQVNEGFGRMFPSLFGGGQAKLIMTGDEVLDAGVQVMAQPPGKKNATIHLLSGGEKALTAIALVFAIFLLNPAPFCLLDEVDAPLDDANTERYAKLVTEMSAGTQFLFISHNKIAMEMAEQLIGVTMQEQGVSRIVAVDMQAAAHLMEKAA
ncbi:MAG: chromosome segregation protein SMC [Proteobacteria bacterium]|nr:chromosome segregation protein SMC [Pseudomonadota bacterium]